MIFRDVQVRYRVNGSQIESVVVAQVGDNEWVMLQGYGGTYAVPLADLERNFNLSSLPSGALLAKMEELQREIKSRKEEIDRYQAMLEAQ